METKRATVYFDPDVHRALRLKAAQTERTMSQLVNEAVESSLREDADDLAAARDRLNETPLRFEDAVAGLRLRGRI